MIDDGVMEGVDSVFAIHLWSGCPWAKLGPRRDLGWPLSTSLTSQLVERRAWFGAHEVLTPCCGLDIVMALQTIVSRELSPLEPV